MKKAILEIEANRGYNHDQVDTDMTVKDLKEMLEGFDDDTIIVTKDLNNEYGAMWGIIRNVDEWEPETWHADIVVLDKETKEEIDRYTYKRVHECDNEEEEIALMKELGVDDEYFDEEKYVIDWEDRDE